MERILIAADSEKAGSTLSSLLFDLSYTDITAALTKNDAENYIFGAGYDLVIINSPFNSDSGINFAVTVSEKTSSAVLIIAREDVLEKIDKKAEECGIFTVPKPLSKAVLKQTLRLISVSYSEISALKKQQNELKKNIYEIKIINRAKATLMSYLNLTEAEAHRFMEKKAMDMRMPKITIAENILKAYED